ncbi:MAG: oligosaccharide flippase family protein [Candidatus Edwardsbacteria bacterium]|nr:oligosaccharide flippase family protein [Candidatus Edwardsbacteria bacterium]
MHKIDPPIKYNFAGQVMTLASGTFMAQLAGFILIPVFSRIFLPEHFGAAAVFDSLASLLGVVICLRYELSIMLPPDENDAISIMALCLLTALTLALVITIGVALNHQTNLIPVRAVLVKPYLWLLPLVLLLKGLYQTVYYWLSRNQKYFLMSVAAVTGSVVSGLIILGFVWGGLINTGALIVGSVGGYLAMSALLTGYFIKVDFKKAVNNFKWADIRRNALRYKKFPLVDAWSSLLNTLNYQLPILLISTFFAQSIVGQYSVVYRLMQLPMGLIVASIAQVFYQRISEQVRNNADYADEITKVVKVLFMVGVFPCIIALLFGQELMTVFLGAKWLEAGKYLQILGIYAFIKFCTSPVSSVLLALEKQGILLIFNVISIIATAVCLFIGGYMIKNIYLALLLFSLTGVVLYSGLLTYIYIISPKVTVKDFLGIINKIVYALPFTLILVMMKYFIKFKDIYITVSAVISLAIYYLVLIRKKEIILPVGNSVK